MNLIDDIRLFYKEYQERIKSLNEYERELITSVNDEEHWKALLNSKTELVHDSYTNNTTQYQSLIKPFIDDPSSLTFEIVDALLTEIYLFTLTHLYDQLLTSNVLYAILTYLRNYNYCEYREIACMHLLGIHLEHLNNQKYIKEAASYFHEITLHADLINTEYPFIRNCIGKSFYNYIVREMDYPEYANLNEVLRTAIRCKEFYNKPENIKLLEPVMDSKLFYSFTIQYLIEKIKEFKHRTEPELFEFLNQEHKLATTQIESMIQDNKPLNALEFSVYYENKYLANEISSDEYIRKCFEYISNIEKPEDQIGTEAYLHSDYFVSVQTVGIKLIEALDTLTVLTDELVDIKKQTLSIMNNVISYMPRINEMRSFTDRVVYDTLKTIIPHLSDEDIKNWIIRFAIIRQTSTAIHSLMVAELSCILYDYLYENHNELLDNDSKTSKDEMLEYIYDAGLFHDIGKTRISNIVKCDYRYLTNEEFNVIKEHPTLGAELTYNSNYLRNYEAMIKGHHKFYNNQGGYPDDFSRDAHNMLVIHDIVSLCDSLDSATDMYGRYYNNPKLIDEVFNEFTNDSGTRYNPVLVKCILEDTILKQLLTNKCTKEERYKIIRDVYVNSHIN